ncbi:MAG: transposase [Planctomycetaceae bacterium]|nr:transposase [Planctomycetaceae bacterium]MBV8608568.1 transposase [Singulisphaera sp.]
MPLILPDIPEADATPLVRQLLEIIRSQQERIQQLEDEIARLKGLRTRPVIAPSRLETPPRQPPRPGQNRPGSAKRSKAAQLIITAEVVVPVPDVPPDSTFKGYEDFIVQDLILRLQVTRYRRERWQTADGQALVAPLPDDVVPGSHFGPDLICFILHQYHHQHVTQPLLLEQLLQLGIAISAGQLSRILTEQKEPFHREKDELLPAGLEVSTYVQVDDTGARHQGRNGYCTHIGNDLFATFESTDSKSRLNFLEVLRRPHIDYVINEVATAYWERQKLVEAVREKLGQGPRDFADRSAWDAHLQALGITGERHVRIATEGALLGSLIAHGVSPELAILSDGAPQFDVLVHASCWIHAERPLARMVPYSDEHRTAIEGVRQRIWELYRDLKAYRQKPEGSEQPLLEARFDALCGERTGFPSIDGVLKEMADHRADLLLVLERPELPLHNNLSEGHVRDYVKKRKISGGTRSESGRRARDSFASLKKTCRRLGVNFWAYLQDRVRGLGQIPSLATLIRQKGEELRACQAGAAPPRGARGGAVA